ncbi:MAG: type II toxin-antitoxin system VapC family toxin [Candidatus Njordarchaeales archaeon]
MGDEEIRYEGIIDVGPIVISHTKNPAQEEALLFLKNVLTGKILCLIPTSVFMGAYIVMTRYLRVRRDQAAKALKRTLSLNIPIFYEDIPKDVVLEALEDASIYDVSSWDAYIAEIAKIRKISIVYTLDIDDFKKIPWLRPVLPISIKKFLEYQKWLKSILKSVE